MSGNELVEIGVRHRQRLLMLVVNGRKPNYEYVWFIDLDILIERDRDLVKSVTSLP